MSAVAEKIAAYSYPPMHSTAAGYIPTDWRAVPFNEVIEIATGQVDPRKEPFRDMILIAPDHIESSTGRLLELETADEQGAISGKYFFSEGDVIYSKIRPYLRKATLARFEGLCSADMYPLRVRKGFDAGFVLASVLGEHFSQYAETVSVRSGMPKINRDELSDYCFAIPPTLAEQESIASALGDADALIESLEQLLAKKRLIKQGAMQELLTGKRRLPGFADDWETVTVRDVCTLINGRGFKPHEWGETGLPIIRIQNLNGSQEFNYFEGDFNNKLLVQHGDLLFAWSGSRGTSFGPHIWWGQQALLNYHTWKLDLHSNRIRKDYFSFYLRVLTEEIEDAAHGASALVHTQKGEMEKYEVKLPSLAEQKEIAKALSALDSELSDLERKLTKSVQIKRAMMQQLLTGRIRLV